MSDMLDAAKLSLTTAEEIEEAQLLAEETFTRPPARGWDGYRDELLLGILQSNIAIAEALTCDGCEPDPEIDLCDEDCEFCACEAEDWAADVADGLAVVAPGDGLLLDPAVRVLIHWGTAG